MQSAEVIGALIAALLARAAPQESAGAGAQDELSRRLSADGIALDRERKEARLRGSLLHRASSEYPIEYALVTERGHTYESFGVARCTPSLLNAALLTLGLKPGTPRHFVEKTPRPPEEDLELGLASPYESAAPRGDRVFLYVHWTQPDGHDGWKAFEDFFLDERTGRPLPVRGFVYVGSRFVTDERTKREVYVADLEGNLVMVHQGHGRPEDALLDVFAQDDAPYRSTEVNPDALPPDDSTIEYVFALAPRADCRPFEEERPRPRLELPPASELRARARNPCFDGSTDAWLERLGTRSVDQLEDVLQQGRLPALREVAAGLLGASKRDEAVEPLTISLRLDRAGEVRIACAFALAEIGSAASIAALIDVLERDAPAVADDALAALRLLSGQEFGRKPAAWRQWAAARRAGR